MNTRKILFTTVVVSMMSTGCITTFNGSVIPSSSETLKSEFSQFTYSGIGAGAQMRCRMYIPDIPAYAKVPLIVYLHGAGQNGNNNENQLDNAVGCLYSFTRERDEYKSVILVPQCPIGVYWRDDEMMENLADLITSTVERVPVIDPNRVYITGFSMGGDATWKLGLAHPEMMTTLVPVCGGPLENMEPDIPDVPDQMADLNIWAFNNFDDKAVRPSYSKRIFARLWEISDSDKLNFTMNMTGGHDGSSVYSNKNLLIWLLNTKK